MRVGIDATGWANHRGHGRFARGAVGRLIELDHEVRYVLFTDAEGAAAIDAPGSTEIRVVALSRPTGQAAAAGSNRSPADLLRLTRAVRHDALDAFLFPSVYTWFPVAGVRSAVGVHDMTARQMPDLTLPDRRARVLWRVKESWAIRSATVVFTVSESSRRAVAHDFGLERERIPVVCEAPDAVFSPRREPPGSGLEPGRYLLSVGGISPHKNLMMLLDAYATLARTHDDPPRLVIAGATEGDSYLSATQSVTARIAALGLGELVVLTGFVADEELARLYSAATATVLPSLAEGFDLPAVEAAACGSPVVLSDLGAHRETLGEAGLFFPPRDVRALTDALERVVTDAELRAELSERARRAVALLSWDRAADTLREIVRATVRPTAASTRRVAA